MHSYIYKVTEKSNKLLEQGKHVFICRDSSVNCITAKQELEKQYGEITSINKMNVPAKTRKAGKRIIRKRKPSTKFIVTFKSKDVQINS